MADSTEAYLERMSAIIEICNQQLFSGLGIRDIDVAASAAQATARFSAWSVARSSVSAKELEARKAHAIETFTNGFRDMLERQFQDQIANFNANFPADDSVVNRPVKRAK